MEQLVARWAHNPKAVGSSPAPATKYLCKHLFYRGIVISGGRLFHILHHKIKESQNLI